MPGSGSPSTPRGRRSNRVLIPTTAASPPSVTEEVFVPRRRSFGIIIKPFDPQRSPARARKSLSKSRSGSLSRSQSRDRLNIPSRNGSRTSSVCSSSSKINRRKSVSMGDLDFDDEFVALDNEIYQEQRSRKREKSTDQLSNRAPKRYKSTDAVCSSSSSIDDDSTDTRVTNLPSTTHRQRSHEFSLNASEERQNQSVNTRSRGTSESTAEASFKIEPKKNGAFAGSSVKSTENNNSSRHGNVGNSDMSDAKFVRRESEWEQLLTISQKTQNQVTKKPMQFISVPHQARKALDDSASTVPAFDSSDDGTDLDDQPWKRPTETLAQHTSMPRDMHNSKVNGKPITNFETAPSHKWINETGTYMNAEERQPLLPLKSPPERPPKIFSPPPLPPKNIPVQNSPRSKADPQHIIPLSQGSPLSTQNFQSNMNLGSCQGGSLCTCGGSQGLPAAPNVSHHTNGQQSCNIHQPMMNSCHCQTGLVFGQNFSSSHAPQPQGWQNQVCTGVQCGHAHDQHLSFSHGISQNGFTESGTDVHRTAPSWNSHHVNQNRGFDSHEMREFRQPLHEGKSPIHNSELANSRRQFKSTVNLRSDELSSDKENAKVRNQSKMHKAKSTDALTIVGTTREEPEVENLEIMPGKMKKMKSTIVLDDLTFADKKVVPDDPLPTLSQDPKRGKLEMWSGLLQLLTICACLLTTVPMAIVSRNWDWHADKCPLYVESNLQHDRLWGNPSMIPCYLSAYLPVIIMAIALTLVFIHGGLLFYWRSKRKSSSFYTRRSFSISLLFFNLVSFAIALAVACMLTDGLRQTCLSFQFISDIDYRPPNCQTGFNGLDLNYNIEGTFYFIIFAMIGAWLAVTFTLISFVLYLVRAEVCQCSVGGTRSKSSAVRQP
ncbi:uncharacterized protein LOC108682637 [Hyalella azteca]|uniref:Uncharacterized protein LOC108682637 n=1 Tax=Hyalella azteca TaxID=294128 RepID=A0A8B7PMW3_HYAAZ|nr:uncharacterized protein LOC108682637 [Hyalella azteca]